MSSMNQCNIIGYLGGDPEGRSLPNDGEVSNFNIGCSWKGKNSEGTEWIPITAFNKLASICNQYLKKGSHVRVTGKFKTQSWEDQQGNKRYKSFIEIYEMEMLGSKNQDRSDQSSSQKPANNQNGNFDDFDDDIPF